MRSKEEVEFANQQLKESQDLAHKMAEYLVSQTDSARVAIFSAGILYASLSSMHGMSMHDCMGLLMEVYKRHEEFMKDQQQ